MSTETPNLASSSLKPEQHPCRISANSDVWHKSHAFTLAIYRATELFPKSETFGLVTTLRRNATELTTKIAEGCGHDLNADFLRCMANARGMGVELEYQLLLTRDLQLLPTELHDALQSQIVEIRRMLSGVLKARSAPSPFDTLTSGIH